MPAIESLAGMARSYSELLFGVVKFIKHQGKEFRHL